jgi:hypothetical protein
VTDRVGVGADSDDYGRHVRASPTMAFRPAGRQLDADAPLATAHRHQDLDYLQRMFPPSSAASNTRNKILAVLREIANKRDIRNVLGR